MIDKRTLMASKTTGPAINGAGRRKFPSWIDQFVSHTDNLDAPEPFRRWAAISTIAATLEQKVWLKSGGGILYPNLYVVLVGHPGTGKTRTVRAAKAYILEIPDYHIAPTSMTAASLIDTLVESKRLIMRPGAEGGDLDYNSMLIAADELGAFIHKYDDEMIAVLSAFYDPDPYGHSRRGKEIKIKIKSPQLNVLCGTTPSNLIKFIPEGAWDQGFTSRLIMVFSDERIIGDDFAAVTRGLSQDLLHDLKVINSQVGEYGVTSDLRDVINKWREEGENPQPNHPKLLHYNTRRRAHLYKLCLVSAVDRSAATIITVDDWHRAKGWLEEAEALMPDIFKAGGTSADSQAMEEIYHFALTMGAHVSESKIVRFASARVPLHSVGRVFETMLKANMLEVSQPDRRTGERYFRAVVKDEDH